MYQKYGLPSLSTKASQKSQLRQATQKRQLKQTPEVTRPAQVSYDSLDQMMQSYGITDVRSLTNLSDEELEQLIDRIDLHEGTIHLKDQLVGITDKRERIRRLIIELAGKLCRCLEGVEKTNPQFKIPICTKSIFHSKGGRFPDILVILLC